jgi:hypothetical protein
LRHLTGQLALLRFFVLRPGSAFSFVATIGRKLLDTGKKS